MAARSAILNPILMNNERNRVIKIRMPHAKFEINKSKNEDCRAPTDKQSDKQTESQH